MRDAAWQWDPSLYSGSAAYYVQGRVAYPQELADCLAAELMLDGSGRLLDVGCGPGSLTLLLAGLFEHATGLDADPDMLTEGQRQAAAAGITNVEWVNMRAEALPPHLGPYRVATLAQAFHWMDRPLVARLLHGVLTRDGALVHVGATTHQGIESNAATPYPRPPRQEIDRLIKRFLGPQRRAGKGTLSDVTASDAEMAAYEADIYRAAGFTDQTRLELPPGDWSSGIPTTLWQACSPCPARLPTCSATAAKPSKPNSGSCYKGSALTDDSASRCARARSTFGALSRPRCTYLFAIGVSKVDLLPYRAEGSRQVK